MAIVYRDGKEVYGSIGVFTHYDELNSIVGKTTKVSDVNFFTIVQPQGIYRFSERFFADFPQAEKMQGKGTGSKIVTKSFAKMDFAFHTRNTSADEISILGLVGGKCEYKWISSKYLVLPESFAKWRVIIAETNNIGVLSSRPMI